MKHTENIFILKQNKALLSLFLFFLFLGCSKNNDNVIEQNIQRPNRGRSVGVKISNYKVLLDANFGANNTKAHWGDAGDKGPVTFEWDETTENDPEMLTLIYGSDAFVKWTSSDKFCYAKTKVTPNSENKMLATLTPLAQPVGEISAGNPVYNLSPIKENNSLLYSQRDGLLAELDMPNSFENNSKKGLSLFKDYTYIYAKTTVASVEGSRSGEGVVKCNNAQFNALSSVFKMSVKNNLSDNQDISIKKIVMRAVKENLEQHLFPHKIKFFIKKDTVYTEDYINKDLYYSSIEAVINEKETVAIGNSKSYYMLFFPTNIENAFKDVTLSFDIIATVGKEERVYTVDYSLSNLPNNNFEAGYIYTFNISVDDATYRESKTHYEDGEVVLACGGKYTNASKIIITGDGYVYDDLKIGGKMDGDMDKAIDAIFSVEPYKSHKEYFKVYKMFARSNERGASGYSDAINKNAKLDKDTKFKISYSSSNSSGLRCENSSLLFEMAEKVPGFDFYEKPNTSVVLLLVNNSKYGGSCYMFDNAFALAMCPMNMEENSSEENVCVNYKNLILHELCGHGFGRLGDEYIIHKNNSINDDSGKLSWLSGDHRNEMSLNVSLTGDSSQVVWKDFIGKPNYDRVGVFLGGFYFGKDVWRCENISCMDNNIPYFNAYSRYLQYKRIKKTVGEQYSIADFIAQDKTALIEVPKISKTKTTINKYYPRLAPPIMVKCEDFER